MNLDNQVSYFIYKTGRSCKKCASKVARRGCAIQSVTAVIIITVLIFNYKYSYYKLFSFSYYHFHVYYHLLIILFIVMKNVRFIIVNLLGIYVIDRWK